MTPTLGPRASLLLGLVGPDRVTAAEALALAELAADVATDPEFVEDVAINAEALTAIRDGGLREVERLLRRLQRFGFVEAAGPPGATLWWVIR